MRWLITGSCLRKSGRPGAEAHLGVHHREAHRPAPGPSASNLAATTLRAVTAPRALVLGVSGQDGSYLAELLLARGYTVTGLVRRAPDPAAFGNLEAVAGQVDLVQGDVADAAALRDLVAAVRPQEIYNVASTSTLQAAWADPLACARETALPVAAPRRASRRRSRR